MKLNIPPFSKGRLVANSTYHTSKKAKEELSLLTNPEPLSHPKHKPLPCLHFQQQMCTITCCTFLSCCHYFNFLDLSFFVVVVSQGNSCLEKEGQQHQALPKSEYMLNMQSKDFILKNFRIFQGNMPPLSMVGIANHLVIVCAAICNLLPPLAK